MKYLISLLCVFISNWLTAQPKVFDKSGYNDIARLCIKYITDNSGDNKPRGLEGFPQNIARYFMDELDFYTIPIFEFKNVGYTCGSDIDTLISFEPNVYDQWIFVGSKKSGKFIERITVDDYYDGFAPGDTIPLRGRTLFYGSDWANRRIYKMLRKNPDYLVFTIPTMWGFWAAYDGKVVRIVNSFGGLGFREIDATYYICKYYGEEFVNDLMSHGGIRWGYTYRGCPRCNRKTD